jgi:hypothetical protein
LSNCQWLTDQGNEGAACTCVATEFHFHRRSDFVVEVTYFTLNDVKNHITDLLRAYRHFHSYEVSPENSAADIEDWKARATIAADTFQAMFSDSIGQNLRFLNENTEDLVQKTLYGWAERLDYLSRTGEPTTNIRTMSDSHSCSTLLSQLSSEHEVGARWPFIQNIS